MLTSSPQFPIASSTPRINLRFVSTGLITASWAKLLPAGHRLAGFACSTQDPRLRRLLGMESDMRAVVGEVVDGTIRAADEAVDGHGEVIDDFRITESGVLCDTPQDGESPQR